MSCPRYSRNKYRCLIPNHNVIVSNDNNICNEAKPKPNPHIYPYYDPGFGRYPAYGYPYGGINPSYGYSAYGYPRLMPYVY